MRLKKYFLKNQSLKYNCKKNGVNLRYDQRKVLVETIRYEDLVVLEENREQKKTDVYEYHIDTLVIGDD